MISYEKRKEIGNTNWGSLIFSTVIYITVLSTLSQLISKDSFFQVSSILLLVAPAVIVAGALLNECAEELYFKRFKQIIKIAVLVSFGFSSIVSLVATFISIVTGNVTPKLISLLITVISFLIVYFGNEIFSFIKNTLRKVVPSKEEKHKDMKYVSRIFKSNKSDDEKFDIVRLVLIKTRQELLNLEKQHWSESIDPLPENIEALSETLSSIHEIQDEEIRKEIIKSTLAIIKVDYVAFLNLYTLVSKYDIFDKDMFPQSEIEKIASRYLHSNNDCSQLLELGKNAVAVKLNDRTDDERDEAKRIIENTLKMMG